MSVNDGSVAPLAVQSVPPVVTNPVLPAVHKFKKFVVCAWSSINIALSIVVAALPVSNKLDNSPVVGLVAAAPIAHHIAAE